MLRECAALALPARSVWPHRREDRTDGVWWECAASELVLARVRPDGAPAGGGALTPHSGLDSPKDCLEQVLPQLRPKMGTN